MVFNLKELAKQPELLTGGHRACAGCAGTIIIRQVLKAAGPDIVVGFATGCMEVVTTIYPYSAWRVPYIHNAFENVAATISGVEAAYKSLKRQGKISRDLRFIAFGGDGGTYDIGLQALSGALERGHRFLYVCYDNQAYMNTSIQRSGATPLGAATNTSPVGKVAAGKAQFKKDLTGIVVAHNIPYVAQASPHNWQDLMRKVRTALDTDGPSFINIISPCHRGWQYPMEETIDVAQMAVDTCLWPLFEVVKGKWIVNYKPKEKKPVVEYLKNEGRFSHLFKPGNEKILEEIQTDVDRKWQELLRREEIGLKL